jgi:hypothetical protein
VVTVNYPDYGAPAPAPIGLTVVTARPPLDPVRAHALYCASVLMAGMRAPAVSQLAASVAEAAGQFEAYLRSEQ